MVKQDASPSWMGWLIVGLGCLLIVSALVRDWSSWPDFRSVLALAIGVIGAGEMVAGAVMLRRAAVRKSDVRESRRGAGDRIREEAE